MTTTVTVRNDGPDDVVVHVLVPHPEFTIAPTKLGNGQLQDFYVHGSQRLVIEEVPR